MRIPTLTAIFATIVLAAGCGQPSAPATEEASEPAAAPEPSGPRAFFVQPRDGATVTSPVMLEFGVEDFEISPVPAGTPTETRPAVGHFHVGIDTDCLPTGEVIPQANPWVHFGDGKNAISMQLPPGQHRLSVQVADDLHRTIEGLCETIEVNVTQ